VTAVSKKGFEADRVLALSIVLEKGMLTAAGFSRTLGVVTAEIALLLRPLFSSASSSKWNISTIFCHFYLALLLFFMASIDFSSSILDNSLRE
jgi:hypothetical protein